MLLEVVLQAAHLLFDTAALQIIKSGECEGKMVSLLLRLITLPSWPCTKLEICISLPWGNNGVNLMSTPLELLNSQSCK